MLAILWASQRALLQLTEPALRVVPGGRGLEAHVVQVAAHAGVLQAVQAVLQAGDLGLQQPREVLLRELLLVVQLAAQLQVADGSLEQRQAASLSQPGLYNLDQLKGKKYYNKNILY